MAGDKRHVGYCNANARYCRSSFAEALRHPDFRAFPGSSLIRKGRRLHQLLSAKV